MKKNKNILGKELSKFTKVALSGLMVVTCAHFSYVSAEDTEETNTEEVITEVTQVEETPEQEVVEEISTETEETAVETSNEEVTSTPETTVVETTDEPEVTETIVATEEPYEIVMPETKEEAVVTEEVEETEQDEEVKLDEMTSDELFNYIMNISADELDALYVEYPNLDDLMANFTEEQQEALANKFGNAEEDIELAEYKEGNDATFETSISNAEVAYFAWHETSDTTGDITFTTVPNGTLTISDFTTNDTWSGWQHISGKPGYVLFFVKTDSEHLVTGLGTSGNGDVFPIDTTDWGNISGYPGLSNVVNAAKEAKYEVAFGYSASAGTTKTGDFVIVGQKPEVTVTASTSAVNVKPNQEITFTVTITPKVLDRTSVTDISVTSATINGQEVTISKLTGPTDGLYTGTVNYTVTQADCESGSVSLVVQTSTDYIATVKSQGQGGTLYTKSTITSEATTSCSIAQKSQVQYEFTSATEGKSLPTEVTSLLPSDTTDYYTGDKVTAKTITSEEVNVDEGTWKFNGWDATSKTMTDDGITFTGSWSFTQKNGKAGYYLSLSTATWNIPEGISPKTEGDKTKYYYDRKFAKDDEFTVVSEIPTATGYQFIGWLDKDRDGQPAAIRNAGDTVKFIYSGADRYCLDALWASISVKDYEGTYDGDPHTISDEAIAINEGTQLDDKYKAQAEALITRGTLEYSTDNVNWSTDKPSFTDAGEYTVYVREIVKLGGQEKTLVGQGTVKINKRPVTFTGNSGSKVYNGQTQTVTGYTANGLVNGHEATLEAQAEGKDANTYTGIITDANYVVIKSGDTDVTKNYAITTTSGSLTITPITSYVEVTITGNKGEFTYDGNPHTVSGFTVTASNDLYITEGENKFYSYSGTASVTKTHVNPLRDCKGNVVSYVMGLLVNDFKNISNNFTNVTFRIYDGEILINPARLTITTASASKPYDGTPLTADGTYKGLVNGETIGFETTGTITEVKYDEITKEVVGETNTYSITWKADGNEYTAKQSNYDVVENLGTLTINPTEGMQVGTLTDVVYNGLEQKQSPTVTNNKRTTLVENTDYTVSYSQGATNVGTVTVTVTGIGNYTGTVQRTYQITPATLYVTTPDATKVYDGTALTAEGTFTGLVNNETVTFVTTGSQTDKGESSNTYTLVFASEEGASEDTNAKRSNYSISQNVGTLTVTAKSITPDDEKTGITVNDPSNHVYDGKDHKEVLTVTDTKTGKTLVKGTDYEVSYDTEDFTNVHEITITVTGIGNYTGSFTKKYAITPASVKVTADNKSKTQGESDPTFTATVEGLIGKDTVTYTLSRNSGEAVGTYTITANGEATQGNYTVTYVTGTLTITKGEEKKEDTKPTPTPTPSVNPGCPAGTVWNEDAKVCQTIVVPVTPTVNPTPNTPTPTVTPSETPEATASAEPEKSAEPTASASAETIVDPDETPEVVTKGHWALINLVAAIVSVLLGIVLVLSKNKKDKDEDEEEQNEDENAEEAKRHKRWKVVSVIDAVLAVVVFIFTENMRLPMVLVDKWTMLMVLFALVSVISLVFGRKYHEEDEEDENQAQA